MRCSWLSTVAVLAVGVPAAAESFRTLIMVDASSSMRRTDPQKLRKVAAELYVDLAREGDLIAIWQFDRSAKDVSRGFQKITGPEVRHRLKDAVRSIGDEGDWTDFGAAFVAVAQAFGDEPAPGEKRFLVFLTDGKCEPAPEEARYLKEGEKPSKMASAEREARRRRAWPGRGRVEVAPRHRAVRRPRGDARAGHGDHPPPHPLGCSSASADTAR